MTHGCHAVKLAPGQGHPDVFMGLLALALGLVQGALVLAGSVSLKLLV